MTIVEQSDTPLTDSAELGVAQDLDRRVDDPSAKRLGLPYPSGVVPGGLAFVAAWAVGVAIARLTGAAAVVLLLVVGAVALGASMISGWIRIRSVGDVHVVTPTLVTVGEPFDVHVHHVDESTSRAPVVATLSTTRSDSTVQLELGAISVATYIVDRPGTVTSLEGSIASSGTGGLLWWKRHIRVQIEPMQVAPIATGPSLDVDERASVHDGSATDGRGRPVGDVDGIRPWRQGESDQSIHWPTTIRSGNIVARARRSAVESRWTIALEQDPGRLRWTLEQGLRHGHDVHVELPDGDTVQVRSADGAAHWATVAADRRRTVESAAPRTPVWKRSLSLRAGVSEPQIVDWLPRWSAAVAAALSLNMLVGALDGTVLTRIIATAGLAVGAGLGVRLRHQTPPLWLRSAVAAIAIGALARIAAQASGIGGLIDALRGPMPDLLMLLLVLHGAECLSRRTIRVHVAFTGVVVAYAAGLRIDDRVGWWMLGWGIASLTALTTLSMRHPDRPSIRDGDPHAPHHVGDESAPYNAHQADRFAAQRKQLARRRWRRTTAWFVLGAAATFGLASLVPIPDGPASLGLPAVSNDDAMIDQAGTLAGPGGNTPPPSNGSPDAPNRGALGEVAGYPGFSDTLDTSVRGDLGDEIVMRVRAPEPAFWRGQTFTEFDGRTWRITGDDGPTISGPQISVSPTLGDLPAPGVPVEEFVQTFHVEADLPNVLFAASRPETVVFDGSVNTRPDGALRADRTLTDGTIYTVVSQRVQVTPDLLRAQGDLATRFAAIDDPRAERLLAPYLEIPASTTQRTIELAERLRVEGSTHDTIVAYEGWLSANTEYDLDAPVPERGADAVDDYLFESQRGFCEQIASSLVVMLRSQGVPTRLATGYIPGERDQISGVWKVRASDAHAWVEVWFPDTGWEAFDPTAFVPLAGDTDSSTVGNDVADAVVDGIMARPVETGIVVLLAGAAVAATRWLTELRRRRARGTWGLLHDRFAALAPDERTVHDVAAALVRRDGSVDPSPIADLLDRVAFDPTYTPSNDDVRFARRTIAELERSYRRSSTARVDDPPSTAARPTTAGSASAPGSRSGSTVSSS